MSVADKLAQLHPDLRVRVRDLLAHSPWPVGITSAWRSPERQAELYAAYLAGTGNPANRPGTSKHEATLHGQPAALAVDLAYAHTTGRTWVHQHAAAFGLHFPFRHEPWHAESNGRPYTPQEDVMSPEQAQQLADVEYRVKRLQEGLDAVYAAVGRIEKQLQQAPQGQ